MNKRIDWSIMDIANCNAEKIEKENDKVGKDILYEEQLTKKDIDDAKLCAFAIVGLFLLGHLLGVWQ